jgi:hypothetical protein
LGRNAKPIDNTGEKAHVPNQTVAHSHRALLTITNHPKVGDVTVSKGTSSLTHGTGGETGHSFKITFTGTGSITTGSYVFHYKGTYK